MPVDDLTSLSDERKDTIARNMVLGGCYLMASLPENKPKDAVIVHRGLDKKRLRHLRDYIDDLIKD